MEGRSNRIQFQTKDDAIVRPDGNGFKPIESDNLKLTSACLKAQRDYGKLFSLFPICITLNEHDECTHFFSASEVKKTVVLENR